MKKVREKEEIMKENVIKFIKNNWQILNFYYITSQIIGISDKFVRAVYEDSSGNYYIGCFLDGGLIKINPKTKKYTIYKNTKWYSGKSCK